MKRSIFFLTLLILSLQLLQAGGVGISPATYKEFFEPGLTKTYSFHSFSSDTSRGVSTYVKGDLAEYVTLSEDYMLGGGAFTATISLPDKIDKPGVHTIFIGVIQAEEDTGGKVGGIAAIQGRIDIIVPFPGEYAESTFAITDINEGEEARYEITSQNLGTQNLKVVSTIEVYKENTTEKVLTKVFKESTIEPRETLTIRGVLATKDFKPGDYFAIATIDWGRNDTINKTFRVGEFTIEIEDYDYLFEQGKINPFNILIQNKWNAPIPEVYASVSITDNGKVMASFKTVSVDTSSWERKNITGYFDTSPLETKRYVARLELNYGGEATSKLVAIYINPSPRAAYVKYTIIASVITIIIIAAFIYLILKIRRLQNAKNKK